MKEMKEIRDPIYGFVTLDDMEWDIVKSQPFQRLQYIHQLAMTYMVYPSASHTRFEHLLGVMHLAGRVFDHLEKYYGTILDESFNWDDATRPRYRKILRLAALLHDIGHAPFSHGAEEELFPHGKDHEWMGVQILNSTEIKEIIENKYRKYGITISEIAYVMTSDAQISGLENPSADLQFLSSLITGELGIDRMDYLVRDSYHLGVRYGMFDVDRLIQTLGVVTTEGMDGPSLAVELGGLHTAESLIMARYSMFLQVYFHDVRRIYDKHLVAYLIKKYKQFPVDSVNDYLQLIEPSILTDIQNDAFTAEDPYLKQIAGRIYFRNHFRAIEITFSRMDFFEEKVKPAISEKFTELISPADKDTCQIILDNPPFKFYKFPKLDEIYIFRKNERGGFNYRSILEESELLWGVKPLTVCRVYIAPEQGAKTKSDLEELCLQLKKEEDALIKETRQG